MLCWNKCLCSNEGTCRHNIPETQDSFKLLSFLPWPGFSPALGICIFLCNIECDQISQGPLKTFVCINENAGILCVQQPVILCQLSLPLLSMCSLETKFRGNVCMVKAQRLPHRRHTILDYNSQRQKKIKFCAAIVLCVLVKKTYSHLSVLSSGMGWEGGLFESWHSRLWKNINMLSLPPRQDHSEDQMKWYLL